MFNITRSQKQHKYVNIIIQSKSFHQINIGMCHYKQETLKNSQISEFKSDNKNTLHNKVPFAHINNEK